MTGAFAALFTWVGDIMKRMESGGANCGGKSGRNSPVETSPSNWWSPNGLETTERAVEAFIEATSGQESCAAAKAEKSRGCAAATAVKGAAGGVAAGVVGGWTHGGLNS